MIGGPAEDRSQEKVKEELCAELAKAARVPVQLRLHFITQNSDGSEIDTQANMVVLGSDAIAAVRALVQRTDILLTAVDRLVNHPRYRRFTSVYDGDPGKRKETTDD